MNLPGVLLPVPVPVAHFDREPSELESLVFESTPSNELLEAFVPLGGDNRIKQAKLGLKNLQRLTEFVIDSSDPEVPAP